MRRALVVLLLFLILIGGLLVFLGSRATEVPTRTIEVDVNVPADAS